MTARRGRHSDHGFTLIELLIVVAIIGLISAIAIPNLFGAIQKAKQKRTMSDMRVITNAIANYMIDNEFFPRLGVSETSALAPHVNYMVPVVPTKDGWAFPYRYQTDAVGSQYTLISFGSNRVPDEPYTFGFTSRFVDDIVHTQGVFLQWPDGVQK